MERPVNIDHKSELGEPSSSMRITPKTETATHINSRFLNKTMEPPMTACDFDLHGEMISGGGSFA